MKRYKLIFIVLMAVLPYTAAGKHIYSERDSLIFESYVKQFSDKADEPFSKLIPNTAKFFLGKPYVASTLEVGESENLVINLREFDCTTLVENSIALSGLIKSGEPTFYNYCLFLEMLRYRHKVVNGYTSRLHYLRDWIHENEKNGVLKNITPDLGGVQTEKTVNFMSTHPKSYKHLKDSPENVQKIKVIEDSINSRNDYIIIPKASIKNIEKDIRNGDIVAFATTIGGLDYSHVGIAYWVGTQLRFIHASSSAKKVVQDTRTISAYCNSLKSCSGIAVLRINDK